VNALRSLSLGAKINIGLLAFLLILAAAASAIIFLGFDRAQDDASRRSQRALEEQGKLALQAFVGGISSVGAVQLETGAEAGRRAALYLAAKPPVADGDGVDPAALDVDTSGRHFDANPDRVTDLIVMSGANPVSPEVSADIEYSKPLDIVFPIVLRGFEGRAGGGAFDPAAISFISTNGVIRSYPPGGTVDATAAASGFAEHTVAVGPDNNPDRRTVWMPPHDGGAQLGQIVTASTPVYAGDAFRGAIDVQFSFDGVIAALNGVQPTPRGFAFYVDSTGVLARTKQFDLLTGEASRNPAVSAVLTAMGTAKPVFPLPVESVELGDEDYFISYTPSGEVGGSVAAAAPVSDITGQAALITAGIRDEGTRTLQTMLVALGGLFVAGLVGATYLNRRLLVAPLHRLTDATRQVAGGDLTANVALGRRDELGDLATDFNVMVKQLRESERVLEQRVEDRTRELTTLLDVVRNVGSTLELRPLLQLILEQLRAIIPYDRSLIMILEDAELRVLATRAEPGFEMEQSQLQLRAPVAEGGVIWELIERGEAAIIEDTRGETPLAVAWRRNNERVLDSALRRVGSWMAVPIRLGERTIGMLAISKEQAGFFTQRHAELATALGTHAGVAINNAELYRTAQQAASLEERQRLARELHDSVSQALYGIALGTRTARMRLGDDPQNAAEPIDYVASLAQAGLAEMRALIFELRPESLEEEGLVAAIEKQAASVGARYKLGVELDLGEEPDCVLDIKEALYRITQEALHNVVKHAQASRVEIRLRRVDGSIELMIRDDGRGFDTAQSFPGHVGLQSMPERARKLGGSLTIDSAPGSGTKVTAELPL